MPVLRITMRKIKEVLRLKLEAKLSHAQIAAALAFPKASSPSMLGLLPSQAWIGLPYKVSTK